jgi:hypothetical protein
MRSAAMKAACENGVQPFPVLQVALVARGQSFGNIIASPAMRQLDVGGVTHITQLGGWSQIKYGSAVKESGLKAVETTVGIADTDGTLLSLLETYDPRGSVCKIDSAVAGLSNVDWEPLFRGVLTDWERKDLYTVLYMKTDDTVLRTPIPSGVFTRAEWGAASDGTIFGTFMPLCLGIHNSWDVTARGMVAATNIRWDKDIGYWWLASVDRQVEITKIYFDGVPQGTAGWRVKQGVYGGNYCTIIEVDEASLPHDDEGILIEGITVGFDCKGPDEDGLITGETLTGAPDQLKAIISEYGYRRPPLAGWRGDHSIIGDGWATVSAYFALHKIESARRFGGDQDPESLAEAIDSFLAAYPWVKIWWDELGKLSICVIDPDDVDPDDDAWIDLHKYNEGGQLPYKPGDRREVYTHLNMPFMWSAAEQKYMSSYEAHDVAALSEKVVLVIENPWSQGRFNEADINNPYNPAAPVDPTFPSTLPNNLVYYWDLDEASGNRVDNVASVVLSDSNSATNDTGINAMAANFVRASTQYLSVTPFTFPTTFTISMWFKQSTVQSYHAVWSKGAGDTCLYLLSGTLHFLTYDDPTFNSSDAEWGSALTSGVWYHAICWYDATGDKRAHLSINNGTSVQGNAHVNPRSDNSNFPFYVGHEGGSGYFDGLIDEVAIWNRVLTSDERTELYNGGTGKFYPLS